MAVVSAVGTPPQEPIRTPPFPGRGATQDAPEGSGWIGDTGETSSDALRAAQRQALAAVMDPVAFDPDTRPANLGQSWDQKARQMVALDHADRLLADGWVRAPELREIAEMAVTQLGLLIKAAELIQMDSPDDRVRHDRLLATHREFEAKARAALRGGAHG